MSFLFTFSLPRLPFANPFVQQEDDNNDTSIADHPGDSSVDSLAIPGAFKPIKPTPISRQAPVRSATRLSDVAGLSSANTNARKRKKMDTMDFDNSFDSKEALQTNDVRRRWAPTPSAAKLARPTTSGTTSAAGYLDTPSKYRNGDPEPSPQIHLADNIQATMDDDQEQGPPVKRRRIAETILSTALSVAIVSTAVGYTAYKLWRDRGKDGEQDPGEPSSSNRREAREPPPPPYAEQGESWYDERYRAGPHSSTPLGPKRTYARSAQSPQMSKVHRKLKGTPIKAGSSRTRRYGSSDGAPMSPKKFDTSGSIFGRPQFEIPLENELEEGTSMIDDQMSWMSERLQGLIADGQKALGKEIVLAEEEDGTGAIDDGADGWRDEEEHGSSSFRDMPISPKYILNSDLLTRKEPGDNINPDLQARMAQARAAYRSRKAQI